MDFKLSRAEKASRDELRAWLDAHCPRDREKIWPTRGSEARAAFLIDWQRQLHAAGYIGLHWPTAYGGRGATVMEHTETLRYANLRILTRLIRGERAGPEGSASKLHFSETWQKVAELGLELLEAYALLAPGSEWTPDDGRWHHRALRSRGNTIQGGSSEIMRNILAERVLGLPKD